jgi:Lipocalin-like domain
MKRNYLALLLITILFIGCATSKEARTYKKTIDGNWQLKTVVTEGITGKVKALVFNEADFNCFIGSNWTFNDRNSLGTYTIDQNAGECVGIKRNIRWSIYEATEKDPKLFQFKRLDDKYKEIDDGAGFRFTIVQADDNTLQLRSNVDFEGKPVAFVYNFVRN